MHHQRALLIKGNSLEKLSPGNWRLGKNVAQAPRCGPSAHLLLTGSFVVSRTAFLFVLFDLSRGPEGSSISLIGLSSVIHATSQRPWLPHPASFFKIRPVW